MHRLSQGPSYGPLEAPPNVPGVGGRPHSGTETSDRLVLGALDCRTARTASVQRDSLHGVECAPAGQRHGAACSRSGHTPTGNGFAGSQCETLQSRARHVNDVRRAKAPQTVPRTPDMTGNAAHLKKEHEGLAGRDGDLTAWRRWGPYVAERSWRTVREDYSGDGNA